MDELERSARIRANLGIEPIIHGQIDICQIAIPHSQKQDILPQKRQILQKSLAEQKTNLVPLIVRRTEAYSELEKYEVVYGADWCLVAKELDIEKLWVWVFDMSDEQAAAAKIEMEQLVGSSVVIVPPVDKPEKIVDGTKEIKRLLEEFGKSFEDKLDTLTNKFEQLEEKTNVRGLEDILNKQLEAIRQQITVLSKEEPLSSLIETPALLNKQIKAISYDIDEIEKVNLLTATKEEIQQALKRVKGDKYTNAVWNAIQHWKQPGRKLSWQNLEKSAKATKGKPDKIDDFGNGTYQKLQQAAYIRH